MKEIKLTKGYVAIVDDEDFDYLSQFLWHARVNKTNVYAATRINKKYTYMHRFLMNPKEKFWVDHKDQNSLNNQKNNLRICTPTENSRNSRSKRLKNKYKGIYYSKDKKRIKRWVAQINTGFKVINLGRYLTPEEAAIAYDKAAIKYFGEFASVNFKKK